METIFLKISTSFNYKKKKNKSFSTNLLSSILQIKSSESKNRIRSKGVPHPTLHVWKRNGDPPSARELPVPYSRRGRHHLAMSQRSNSQTPAALRGRIAYTSRSHPLLTMHEFSFFLRGRWRRVDRNVTSSSTIVTETRPGFMGQRFATRTGR